LRVPWVVTAAWALRIASAQAEPAPDEQPPAQQQPPAPEQPAPEQPPAEPPKPVEKPPAVVAFEEGRALLEAKKPDEACAKFEESLRLDADAPGTMLNLGMCNSERDRMATSLKWFRKALARSAEIHLDEAYITAARDKSVEISSKVPTLSVKVPRGSTTTLDGAPLAELDRARVEVDAGTHTVEMTVPGHLPQHEQVTVHDGEHKTVTLVPEVEIDMGVPVRHRAMVIGAIGLGMWAADFGFMVFVKHESDQAERPEDLSRWKNIAHYGGTGLFIAGAAVLGYAAYKYTTAPGHELVPMVSPNGVGVAAIGSF
jgi:hypothetical protein